MELCAGLTLWKTDVQSMNNLPKATKVNIISQDNTSEVQASSTWFRLQQSAKSHSILEHLSQQ